MDVTNLSLLSISVVLILIFLLFADFQQKFSKLFYKSNTDLRIKISIILGVLFLIYGIFSPYITPVFYKIFEESSSDKSNLNELGDAVGGMMSPFVAIAGVIFTFLAFYMQKKANDDIKNQFVIQQFENQFYEMLRLHKENVNEIELNTKNGEQLKGRIAFHEMKKEFEILLTFTREYEGRNLDKELVSIAYEKYFWGFDNEVVFLRIPLALTEWDESSYDTQLLRLKNKESTQKIFEAQVLLEKNLKIPFLQGYHVHLGHYYRHLFHTVKYVTSRTFLDYDAKLNYLRILRAQLSNYEQVMLFYNWLSDYGDQWENDANQFFTRYKMIHNLWSSQILDEEFFQSELKSLIIKYRSLGLKDDLFESGDKKIMGEE